LGSSLRSCGMPRKKSTLRHVTTVRPSTSTVTLDPYSAPHGISAALVGRARRSHTRLPAPRDLGHFRSRRQLRAIRYRPVRNSGLDADLIWKNRPAAVFRTSASFPLAKSVVFASCFCSRSINKNPRVRRRLDQQHIPSRRPMRLWPMDGYVLPIQPETAPPPNLAPVSSSSPGSCVSVLEVPTGFPPHRPSTPLEFSPGIPKIARSGAGRHNAGLRA
jgi:hypothetical protein